MIAKLRNRFRQWLLTRDVLLINFGSDPGRVPFIILSRKEITDVKQRGTQISFSSNSPAQQGWSFVIHTKTVEAAKFIRYELENHRRYILEATAEITAIAHTRLEDGDKCQPRLVGGDISMIGVSVSDYWRHANKAWMLRKVYSKKDTATK